jgi:hypothetical protein
MGKNESVKGYGFLTRFEKYSLEDSKVSFSMLAGTHRKNGWTWLQPIINFALCGSPLKPNKEGKRLDDVFLTFFTSHKYSF